MSTEAATPSDAAEEDRKNEHQRDLKDLLIKSGISLIFKVTGGAAAFGMSVVLGRQLGASGAGVFFLALAIITLLAAVARTGFDQAVTRFVSEARSRNDDDAINGLYRTVQSRILVTSTFIAATVYLVAPHVAERVFHDPSLGPVLRIMSWAIIGFAISWNHAHFFQGINAIKRFQLFQNLGVVVTFLVLLAATTTLTRQMRVSTAAACYLGATILMALLAIAWWRTGHSWTTWRPSPAARHEIMDVRLSLFAIEMLSQSMIWLPQLCLGVFWASDQVGIYNAAFRTANLTSLALLGVNSVVFPRFAALYAQGEMQRLRMICQSSTLVMLAICLPLLLILLLFPAQVLAIFGHEFPAGATALRILALGQLVNVGTGSVGGLLVMTGHQRASLRCGTLALAVQILILLTCVPAIGSPGAALATAIAITVNMLAMSYACYRAFGFAPLGGKGRQARLPE